MDARVRTMTPDDVPHGMRLNSIVGWNQTRADWERFLSASPDGCFVAEDDGAVVGTSATIVYQGRVAWIGMVIVDPEHRSRGIGVALLERALAHLDARGVPCIKLDATPQGKPLYEKLGFASEYGIERWMLRREAHCGPGPPGDASAVEEVLRWDREVFGVDRSGLLRSLMAGAPELSVVLRGSAGIGGYALGRRGLRADHLGPWIAEDRGVAAALLDEFLVRSARELAFVDCVRPNPWGRALLEARGFEFSRPLTRMFRGRNEWPGRVDRQCAILGPEFG